MRDRKIENLMGEKDFAALRRAGGSPLVAAYRVAHEGVSTGAVAGMGRTVKRWSAAHVEELAGKLAGAPVFIGHRDGVGPRPPVGYVLKARNINGKHGAEAIAVVVLENPMAAEKVKGEKLDTVSVEADLVLEPGDDSWNVAAVEAVTGLALADSSVHTPGFERAGLLAGTTELDARDDNGDGDDNEPEPAVAGQPLGDILRTETRDLNLSDPERNYVYRRIDERVGSENPPPEEVRDEVNLAVRALDEAKRLYRQPPRKTPVPFEKKRGPFNYADPDHNDFIPRRKRSLNGL